jgi:hypothetical protein
VAKYSYNELKVAAAEGRRIGGYKGKNVFSCSKWKYDALKSKDAFYVLYDDGNKLVHDGIIYGTISDGGLVDEWEYERQRTWVSPQSQVAVTFEPVSPAKHKAQSQATQKTVPASAYSAMVNGGEGIVSSENFFANLDKEINELLAKPFVFDVGEDMPWVNKA